MEEEKRKEHAYQPIKRYFLAADQADKQ